MDTAEFDFEAPALKLGCHVERLCRTQDELRIDLQGEIDELRAKAASALRDTWRSLSAWQIAKVARHPQRPHTLSYLRSVFTDFVELHGDRATADDGAVVGGLARFDGRPVVVLGHEKGDNVKDRVARNFGMPRPEGYRKGMRLMELAERFQLPLVTFIDTPGAYPGPDAEERGQSAAIGESIFRMSQLSVPTLAVIIGEGGSGGALALGLADTVCMLEYAMYSVISPEGGASILWKDAAHAEAAANALAITAPRLKSLHLIDEVVAEPLGGAHRDPAQAAQAVAETLRRLLPDLCAMEPGPRLALRHARLRAFGAFSEVAAPDTDDCAHGPHERHVVQTGNVPVSGLF